MNTHTEHERLVGIVPALRRPYTAPTSDAISFGASRMFAASNHEGSGNGWIDDDDEELEFDGKEHEWEEEDEIFSTPLAAIDFDALNPYRM